jgi:ABC-type transporter Mla MlaB component
MLRITRQPAADHDTLLLEGKLSKELIEELQQALAQARQNAPITLDLSGLRFVDDEGAHFLRDCSRRGASLLGASPFVSALLDLPTRPP